MYIIRNSDDSFIAFIANDKVVYPKYTSVFVGDRSINEMLKVYLELNESSITLIDSRLKCLIAYVCLYHDDPIVFDVDKRVALDIYSYGYSFCDIMIGTMSRNQIRQFIFLRYVIVEMLKCVAWNPSVAASIVCSVKSTDGFIHIPIIYNYIRCVIVYNTPQLEFRHVQNSVYNMLKYPSAMSIAKCSRDIDTSTQLYIALKELVEAEVLLISPI